MHPLVLSASSSSPITYFQAIVIGLLQGVTELFPISSLGHSVLLPQVFGWDTKQSDMGEGNPPYNEFLLNGESIAGGMEMNPMVPAEVPSHWLVYFMVEDVDKGFQKAIDGGGKELLAPMDFPGGRFAIIQDPQGAAFGILNMPAAS